MQALNRPGVGLAATLVLCAFASPAWAHDPSGLAGGFISGLKHPVSGLDHLLAMFAVGLWGAYLGRPLVVALPVIFPAVMVVGGLLGIAGVPIPPVEVGIALSVCLLGAVIAAAYRAPVWLACALVGVFGLFHGYAHGQELPTASDPVAYGLGFVLATGALHGAGILVGLLNRRAEGRTATRLLGGAIAAAGVWFLFGAVAG